MLQGVNRPVKLGPKRGGCQSKTGGILETTLITEVDLWYEYSEFNPISEWSFSCDIKRFFKF